MVEVGRKIRGNEVVAVTDNGKVFAVYSPGDMGAKGRIYAKASEGLTYETRREMVEAGFPYIMVDGEWYFLIEYVPDYPRIFTRMNWWANSMKSAYSK